MFYQLIGSPRYLGIQILDYRSFQKCWSKRSENSETVTLLLKWISSKITFLLHYSYVYWYLCLDFNLLPFLITSLTVLSVAMYKVMGIQVSAIQCFTINFGSPWYRFFQSLNRKRQPLLLCCCFEIAIYCHKYFSIIPLKHTLYRERGLLGNLSLWESRKIY